MRVATCVALPAVTAPRDANVPTPHGNLLVSPLVISTSRMSTPSSSATTCAQTVACAWPWLGMPVAATTLPDTSTCTCAPSYGPTPVPSTYMPRPMPTFSPAGLGPSFSSAVSRSFGKLPLSYTTVLPSCQPTPTSY